MVLKGYCFGVFGSSPQLKDEENGDGKWDSSADAVSFLIQGEDGLCSQENAARKR